MKDALTFDYELCSILATLTCLHRHQNLKEAGYLLRVIFWK